MLNTMQNLSKRNPAHLVLRKSIKAPQGMKIVACDSSQIEARVLAWEANQYDLLEHFRTGRDPYAELAAKFGSGMSAQEIHDGAKSGDKKCKHFRNLGKLFTLSAGYSVGHVKVANRLWQDKVRLDEDFDRHKAIAKEYLQIYRTTNSSIVAFWKTCGKVIEAMCVGGAGKFGGPNNDTFEYGRMRLGPLDMYVPSIKLPNGYILRYPGLRAKETDKGIEYVFDFKLGKNTVERRVYSGLVAENTTQSLAFAALQFQACRMDEDGIELKCNIHDSWATVVPENEAEAMGQRMQWHMQQVPPWLQGCPLDAEYEIGDDFTVV